MAAPTGPVTVFRSGDPGRIAIAKSILQSADVPFVAVNESAQQWIGAGISPFNVAIGPVEIKVAPADAEDARAMLQDLERGGAWCVEEDEDEDERHR